MNKNAVVQSTINRFISPPKHEWDKLRQPLNEGERKFVEYLDEQLDPAWEIYIHPSLNGLCPDVVILHPEKGICLLEIKDWDFNAIRYETYTNPNTGKLHLQGTSNTQGTYRIRRNPVDQLLLYRKEMSHIYCPQLSTNGGRAALFCGLAFPSASKAQLEESIIPIFRDRGRSLVYDNPNAYYFIFSQEDFINAIEDSFPKKITSNYKNSAMNSIIASYLRPWLVEPDASKEQRQPLILDNKQLELATTRTTSGYRRLKGPAGSGKSLIIAKKASELLKKRKRVLVVTFNLTLINYLIDLCVRDYKLARRDENATWLNFHYLASRLCLEAGLEQAYHDLFKGIGDNDFINDNALCNLLEYAIQNYDFEKYDAILVDEGQDFNPRWWNILRSLLKTEKDLMPGENLEAEMLLVADTTQDIYGNGKKWTDEAMKNAGFSGPWATLESTYRLPPALIPMIQDFANLFIPHANIVLPQPPKNSAQGDIFSGDRTDAGNIIFRWLNISKFDDERAFDGYLDQPINDFSKDVEKLGLSFSDQTYLVTNHKLGGWITNSLKRRKKNVLDVFSKDWKESRRKKIYFFKGSQKIKASTIHSYKGWESNALFIIVDNMNFNKQDSEVLYTALTRIKGGGKSLLYVVCSDRKLFEFGERWNSYYNY